MKVRLLASATAVLLLSSIGLAAPATSAAATPLRPAGRGAVVAPLTMTGVASPARPGRRATTWPVRTRTSTLIRAAGTTPSADPSQTFTAVSMVQDLKYGALSVDIHLGAVPTTDSEITFGFGTVTTDSTGSTCNPDATASKSIHSTDTEATGTTGNPSYDGAHIVVKPFAFAAAKKASWGCFYTVLTDGAATPTTYDAWTGGFTNHIQKPELTIKVANRKLTAKRFTRVPITIHNSAATIATAKHTRLTWRTQGVTLRGNHNVGSIAPGAGRKSYLLIRGSRSGHGRILLTATSGDYHHTVRLTVRPV